MIKENFRNFLIYLSSESGFTPPGRFYFNYRFALALLAGFLVVWIMQNWMPSFSTDIEFSWPLLLSLVIWQPLVEEVLFRGLIQGQLAKRDWGKRAWLNISVANVITSVLFVVVHMFHNSPLFALTLFVPSLVFGYFRDYCNSVYPSIVIHSSYNAMVFVGLIINGNIKIPSL
jgi:membrane protease YdiL (CAAX protease family)